MQHLVAVWFVSALLLVGTRTEDKCTKPDGASCGDTDLPAWCYHPEGREDCSFYVDCLEKRHPCEQSGTSYAIDYGLKFCNLFQGAYSKFSADGQRWVDAVRQCLQVKLVPFLTPHQEPSCQAIMEEAFAMHPGCYLAPAPGAPSVCDLGWKDRMRLLWTVKGSLLDPESIKLTLKQMIEVAASCLGIDDRDLIEDMFMADL